MARVSKITLAQRQIADYFRAIGRSAFSYKEIATIIDEKRGTWELPVTTSIERILQKLVENTFIKNVVLTLTDETEHSIFLFEEPTIFEIAVALRPRSFISHYPAVFLHDLTTQVPKTIYTTAEQSQKRFAKESDISQSSIDKAFSAPQRRSNLFTEYDSYSIILLSSKFSNRTGVLLSSRHRNAFSLTNVERTLIDITVRPNYAGGAFSVLEAYRRAVDRKMISFNKLSAALESMDFIYPYHQSIGFYLERAGYEGKLLEKLKGKPMQFKFYLDYDMVDKTFNKDWQLWHPKGM